MGHLSRTFQCIFDHPRSGVIYNFGRVCLSDRQTYESADVGSSMVHISTLARCIFRQHRSSSYEGHRVKVKVTGATSPQSRYVELRLSTARGSATIGTGDIYTTLNFEEWGR